jgi:hypothetical protein
LLRAAQAAQFGKIVTSVYAAILREVRAKGKDARFRKTDRGKFEATAAARQ